MYNEYFGFTQQPFENNLDLRFLYLSENHKEVVAALLYFIRENKAFALVCGDVGTGKTMIIHHFLQGLPAFVQPIMISSPDVEYSELLRYVARKIGVADSANTLELFDELRGALEAAAGRGQRFVLIIDEAHLLSNQSLEGVRLLSNLETRERKLLQILLVGQYELSHKLDRTEMRQLRQRININRFLSPMDLSETIAYIEHRLAVAGADFALCFEPGCSRLIHSMTAGVPRQINSLCDHALLICQAKRLTKINRSVLRQARDALQSDRVLTPRGGRAPFDFLIRLVRFGLPLMLLILVGFLFDAGFPGIGLQQLTGRLAALKSYTTDHREGPNRSLSVPEGVRRERLAKTAGEHPESSAIPPGKLTHSLSARIVERDIDSFSSAGKGRAEPKPVTHLTGNVKSGEPAAEPVALQRRDPAQGLGREGGQTAAAVVREQSGNPRARTQNLAAVESGDRDKMNPQLARSAAERLPAAVDTKGGNGGFAVVKSIPENRIETVKKGDTLMEIAMQWYPQDPIRGLRAILHFNPAITNRDLIYPGQVLKMPELN